jgi:WD40 repeat protein
MMRLMRAFLIFLLFTAFLAGCTPAEPEPLQKISPTVSSSASITPLPTASSTPASTATPTLTATTTLSITPSQVPTATPTPDLPVRAGTSMPIPDQAITHSNVAQLRELAHFGSARLLETFTSASGSRIFAATSAGVYIYELGNDNPLAMIEIYPRDTYRNDNFSVNADGSRLLVITQEDVKVFAESGELLRSIPPPTGEYWSARANLSPDGKLAALSACGLIEQRWVCKFQVLQVDDGSQLTSGNGQVVQFSPAGDLLAVEFDRKVWLYQSSDWTQSGRLWKESEWKMTFSPNGALIAMAHKDKVELWRIADEKMIRVITGFTHSTSSPPSMVFSPNSQIIALLDEKREFTVWQISSGERMARLEETGSRLDIFQVTDSGELSIQSSPQLPSNQVVFTEWQPVIIKQGNTGIVQLGQQWNRSSQNVSGTLCWLDFSGPGDCLEADWLLISAQDGDIYALFPDPEPGRYQIRLTRMKDGVLQLEDQALDKIRANQSILMPIFLDVEAGIFAWTEMNWENLSGMRSYLWDITNHKRLQQWNGEIHQIQLSKDGQIAAFMTRSFSGFRQSGRGMSVIDLSTGKQIYNPQLESATNTNFLLNPDGETLLRSEGRYGPYDNLIKLAWVQMPGGKVTALGQFTYPIAQLNFIVQKVISPDGSLLALGLGSGMVKMIDLTSGQEIYQWQAHFGEVLGIDFSLDGHLLVTRGRDGFLRVWGIW